MEEYRRLYTYGVDTLGQAYELHCLPYECTFSIFRGRPLISEIMNGYFRGTTGLEGVHNFHSTAARCPPYLGLFYKKKYSKISRSRIPDSRSQIYRIGSISGIIAPVYQVVFTKARDSSINALSMKYTRQGMQKQCHGRKCHPNAASIDCRLKGEESRVTEIKQKG